MNQRSAKLQAVVVASALGLAQVNLASRLHAADPSVEAILQALEARDKKLVNVRGTFRFGGAPSAQFVRDHQTKREVKAEDLSLPTEHEFAEATDGRYILKAGQELPGGEQRTERVRWFDGRQSYAYQRDFGPKKNDSGQLTIGKDGRGEYDLWSSWRLLMGLPGKNRRSLVELIRRAGSPAPRPVRRSDWVEFELGALDGKSNDAERTRWQLDPQHDWAVRELVVERRADRAASWFRFNVWTIDKLKQDFGVWYPASAVKRTFTAAGVESFVDNFTMTSFELLAELPTSTFQFKIADGASVVDAKTGRTSVYHRKPTDLAPKENDRLIAEQKVPSPNPPKPSTPNVPITHPAAASIWIGWLVAGFGVVILAVAGGLALRRRRAG